MEVENLKNLIAAGEGVWLTTLLNRLSKTMQATMQDHASYHTSTIQAEAKLRPS